MAMRTEIIFHPAKHSRYRSELAPVRGYLSKYGLVLHRSLSDCRRPRGYWDVSDIETGCLVAHGDYPGIEGAVAALVQAAREWACFPGGFAAALAIARHNDANGFRLALSAFPGGEPVMIDGREVAELYAGLNATAIKMRDGTEYLVHEAAEVIRQRVHDRTGISVPIV